ncbi:ribonuclease E [Kitasatospora cheerisanensis KCTC 2395]|uniref:Ribonuclease E n=1 Tax=Kitasatospora cheerisanensis KCTC 2395 TaxID=1348663 RepID=A0A066YVE0_9ACTN|nr:ribonuclease E [Kitasatospora cheerisanensis KCTC 2395]
MRPRVRTTAPWEPEPPEQARPAGESGGTSCPDAEPGGLTGDTPACSKTPNRSPLRPTTPTTAPPPPRRAAVAGRSPARPAPRRAPPARAPRPSSPPRRAPSSRRPPRPRPSRPPRSPSGPGAPASAPSPRPARRRSPPRRRRAGGRGARGRAGRRAGRGGEARSGPPGAQARLRARPEPRAGRGAGGRGGRRRGDRRGAGRRAGRRAGRGGEARSGPPGAQARLRARPEPRAGRGAGGRGARRRGDRRGARGRAGRRGARGRRAAARPPPCRPPLHRDLPGPGVPGARRSRSRREGRARQGRARRQGRAGPGRRPAGRARGRRVRVQRRRPPPPGAHRGARPAAREGHQGREGRRAARQAGQGRPAARPARPGRAGRGPAEVEAPAAGPEQESEWEEDGRPSRRRRRGGRRRRRGDAEDAHESAEAVEADTEDAHEEPEAQDAHDEGEDDGEDDLAAGLSSSRRRRRRRRRSGEGAEQGETTEDGVRTVVKVREPRRRSTEPAFDPDEVQSIKGSTRLEAKKQRRREGRELGRRRVPIITEAEFLARRESVERVMVVRQTGTRTQIGVLEDGVLVEHYVNKEQATSYVGNVYLGKVQNVLPSMEAAFVDIGKGRNAVLYAGEVNFGALGGHGGPRRIESVLKSGQSVLVQVSKDPIGHKGARLTSQISLPGRYLVYVPEGSMTGISRKLPENERARLKQILKKIVPDDAGVIVRTAAEGASEEELTRDVQRLQQQWEEIQKKAASGNAPALLYGEPDMTVRVVRDIFNEDFTKVIVSGADAWSTIHDYVSNVAPDLTERLQRWTSDVDVFATYRIDEQLMKALDRKVWLPSGGSLVIDRTEAMVVVDVNTGKFVGQGGNLEETVTRNNIEAAEEIVRQLRLRDLGGIIVIDFIDMVLESNRDLVLRRLLECLGRDRTKHQVAEVTSLGLVQMTRKRVGQGLLESFSEPCVHCNGRGVIVHMDQPHSHGGGTAAAAATGAGEGGGKRRRRGRGGAGQAEAETVETVEGVEPVEAEELEPIEEPAEVVEAAEAVVAEPVAVEEPAAAEPVAEEKPSLVEIPPTAAPAGRTRRRAVRKATAPAGASGEAEIVVLQARAEAAMEAALSAAEKSAAEPAPAAEPAEAVAAEETGAEAAEPAEAGVEAEETVEEAAPKKRAARKTAAKTTAKKTTAAKKTAAKKTTAAAAKKTTARKTATKRTSAAAKKAAAAEGDGAAE